MGNFISLYGAVDAQGYALTGDYLVDVSAANTAVVFPETTNNYQGTPVACFKFFYNSPKNLEYQFFYLPVSTELPTLTEVNTALNALSTSNSFSLYSLLLAINDAPNSNGNGIVISDNLVNSKVYNPGTNTTDIYVNVVNNLLYNKYTVDGDATVAGGYGYFGE